MVLNDPDRFISEPDWAANPDRFIAEPDWCVGNEKTNWNRGMLSSNSGSVLKINIWLKVEEHVLIKHTGMMS